MVENEIEQRLENEYNLGFNDGRRKGWIEGFKEIHIFLKEHPLTTILELKEFIEGRLISKE